jgi:choline dehydrogenase-like flavoprotein
MLRDFEKDKTLGKYDVCIVGGGPAGITLALKLADKGMSVALLEAGGLAYSEASQSLYAVEKQGLDLYAETTRLRYLGGTSNHWSGRCRPFEAADFTTPPPTGLPGWPISFDEFNRTLPAAMRILDLPEGGFAENNADMPGGLFPADRHAQSAPTRFAEKYLEAMKSSPKLHLHVNCNLVDMVFDPGSGAIRQLIVADYSGRRASVTAGRYVLAMGAIENARMLLNSTSLQTSALPSFKWVGRCLMEHLNVDLGTFMAAEGTRSTDLQYFTSEALVAREGVGRGNIAFGQLSEVVSYGRTAAIKTFMKTLACNLGVADKVQFITKFQCPGAGTIGTLLEQFPSVQGSRVELAEARDALGLRKARVTWTLAPEDKQTIRRLSLAVAKNFAEAGLGFVKLHPAMTDNALELPVSPHAHHMGTTRMASSAEWGVVDENCRMFGVRNLYIAGSSIFPTGGGGNPTMPLIQLALRLSEHLGKISARV